MPKSPSTPSHGNKHNTSYSSFFASATPNPRNTQQHHNVQINSPYFRKHVSPESTPENMELLNKKSESDNISTKEDKSWQELLPEHLLRCKPQLIQGCASPSINLLTLIIPRGITRRLVEIIDRHMFIEQNNGENCHPCLQGNAPAMADSARHALGYTQPLLSHLDAHTNFPFTSSTPRKNGKSPQTLRYPKTSPRHHQTQCTLCHFPTISRQVTPK